MRAKASLLVLQLVLLAAILFWLPPPAAAESLLPLAAGGSHTCAFTPAGGVQCWGRNEFGQLGDSTTTASASPVDVVGLTEGVVDLAAGQFHTCAVTTGGGVQCWGRNEEGQLGDGAGGVPGAMNATPVNVAGLGSGVVTVTAGWFHTCVLTDTGDVKCWGKNEDGQLGDGQSCSTLLCPTPTDVVGLPPDVSTLTVGGEHSCTTTADAGLKCWGRNNEGQLGDGTSTDRTTPVNVVGLSSNVADVALGGRHTCAITGTLGAAKCWGNNLFGQLGDDGVCGTNCTTPVDVPLLSVGMTDIDVGFFHSCALTSSSFALCWGHNVFGQLGNGLVCSPTCTTPTGVQGLPGGVAALAAGSFHTCAVVTLESAKCWGSNEGGQLGDGTSGNNRLLPVDVLGIEPKPTPTTTPTFTPTPTATPIPVGGIAKLPAVATAPLEASSSSVGTGLVAGIVAALAVGVLAMGGAAWYARRRWVK